MESSQRHSLPLPTSSSSVARVTSPSTASSNSTLPTSSKNPHPMPSRPKRRRQANNLDDAHTTRPKRKQNARKHEVALVMGFRGVTRHRFSDRYEAHLLDKNYWDPIKKKKGRLVYLGLYKNADEAARAHDLGALKYWGQQALLNYPASTYWKEYEEMQGLTTDVYITELVRWSQTYTQGISKYRGVSWHNGRWEASIGNTRGSNCLNLGSFGTEEEAAEAYDRAVLCHRGHNALTNFDKSRYMKPGQEPQMSTMPSPQQTLAQPVYRPQSSQYLQPQWNTQLQAEVLPQQLPLQELNNSQNMPHVSPIEAIEQAFDANFGEFLELLSSSPKLQRPEPNLQQQTEVLESSPVLQPQPDHQPTHLIYTSEESPSLEPQMQVDLSGETSLSSYDNGLGSEVDVGNDFIDNTEHHFDWAELIVGGNGDYNRDAITSGGGISASRGERASGSWTWSSLCQFLFD